MRGEVQGALQCSLSMASPHSLLLRSWLYHAPCQHFTLFTRPVQEHEGLHHHPPHRLLRAAHLGAR